MRDFVFAFTILLCLLPLGDFARAQESSFATGDPWQTHYEASGGTESATYLSAIDFYRRLAERFDRVQMQAAGPTDSGFPLHLVLVSDDGGFDLGKARAAGKSVLLINNAIHPGEPDGVDASMMLVRDLARDGLPENVIVAVIPIYNIGGALNRNSGTRANQNGPKEYGFRGNAQNYDLNRDFIKCDTRNAQSFAAIFQQLDPDVLIDTHVSNGSDYQYVMTSAHSQKDKLGLGIGEFFATTFQPAVFAAMSEAGFETVPYVNSGGSPPDRGFTQFLESPRYSTGYAALFQTMGFMTETHMLKPYPQRVAATRAFLDATIELLSKHGAEIQAIRKKDRDRYLEQATVPIAWAVDRTKPSKLEFRGYQASRIPSSVTPGQRLFYDRSKPFTKTIDFYDHFTASKTVGLPAGYLIPQGWHRVIERMKINRVEMTRLQEDESIDAQVYRIENVTTRTSPYEGHYLHDSIELTMNRQQVQARAGDYLVSTRQPRARYIVETLEPEAMDSFMRWNFFDTVLQQKEHFSPYVFEEIAAELLADNPELREKLAERIAGDSDFAADRYAQLQFLYKNSLHYEAAHRTYPVARIVDAALFREVSADSISGSDDSPQPTGQKNR